MKRPRERILKRKKLAWTTQIYHALYKNHPPIPFRKTTEIIEDIHKRMMDHIYKHRRPIQLSKTIGYLEFVKHKQENQNTHIVNWPKTLAKGKWVKELNHHTSGYVFYVRMETPRRGPLRMYKFIPLKKHKHRLAKLIFSKDVQ